MPLFYIYKFILHLSCLFFFLILVFLTKFSLVFFGLFLDIHQIPQAHGRKSERLMYRVAKCDQSHVIPQYSPTPGASENTKMIRKHREVSPSEVIHAFH